ncbi:MAG: thiol:disulfide interchange protein DsbA/DsbL [Methylococcales bacterium]|nr:thiol:disulfide interchange protein DsbA/DsbL [Methylococcales bacterium]
MIKTLTRFIISLTLLLATHVHAQQGYEVLANPQPTANPDKIEVIEFFWYGCPHCYSLEPLLEQWLKTKPDNVEFIRQPAAFSAIWEHHARVFFTAEALGVLDKVHADLFDTIQNKSNKLTDESALIAFFKTYGIDAEAFKAAYHSFLVDSKTRQAKSLPARYGITGVPTLVINGKYKTSGPIAKGHDKMLQALDRLIALESAHDQ